MTRQLTLDLREALRLETSLKRVDILYRGTSKNEKNCNKIEPNSPRDLILCSFPLLQTSLNVLAEIRLLPEIGQNIPKKRQNLAQEGIHFRFRSATGYANCRN